MLTDWEAVLRRWHDNAVDDLKKNGTTPFILHIYPQSGDKAIVWIEPDGLSDKGRLRLRLLNTTLSILNPAAVLVVTDAWTPSQKFNERYGLVGVSLQETKRRYLDVLNREYGGRLANAPDDLRSETVWSGIKGPQFLAMGMMTHYHRENAQVVIDETMEPNRHGMQNLVKDWWERVIQ